MSRSTAAFAAAVLLGLAPPTLAAGPGDDRNRHNNGPNDDLRVYLNRALNSNAEDPCSAGFVFQGSGSPNTGWARKRNLDAGIELGIKAIMRRSNDIPASYVDSNGLVHFEVPTGSFSGPGGPDSDLAEWNFNYSYNVGLNGGTASLARYVVELWVDTDPSERQDYAKVRLSRNTAPDDGACPQANGYAWKASDGSVLISDDEGNDQVSQNSQNIAWWPTDRNRHRNGNQEYTFGRGQFDIVMAVKKRFHGKPRGRDKDSDTVLHVVIDAVDGGTAQPDNVGP
jgi:hypothetical protein